MQDRGSELPRINLPTLFGKSGCAPKWGSEGGQEGSKRPRSATSQRPITTLQRPQVIFQTVSLRTPLNSGNKKGRAPSPSGQALGRTR
jgi:hypothetical protein